MNFNVWNIKEMLSVPPGPGTNKSSSWNNSLHDCSSLTDSQFLFGSQFCPENSQSLSASLDFNAHSRHAKTSQQPSEDSEPSIFTKYQAKPQLFGGDGKDGHLLIPHLPIGKSKGILEQFEENKKRAQDKQDRYANIRKESEALNNFISYVRESMHRLQTSVEKLEEELSSRNQSILDSLEAVAKKLQESAQAHCNLLLETLGDKSRMEQRALEMEKQLETREAEFLDMKSSLKHLEVLAAEQSRQHHRLCDQLDQFNFPNVLAETQSLGSEAQLPFHVDDGDSQIFPALLQASSLTRKGKPISESPDRGETIMLLPHLNPLTSSHQCGKCSADKQEAEDETHRLDRNARNAATFWLDKGNRSVKDEAVQTDLEPQAPAKRLSDNRDSSSKIYGDRCKRDLMVQETSQFSSMTVKDLVTKARPTCILQEYQPAALCRTNTHDQNTVLEQTGKSIELRKRVKRKKPRKVRRGPFIRRKSSGLSRNTFTFCSSVEDPQSEEHDVFLGQVESPRQPLPLLCPSKTLQPVVKGRGRAEKAERADSPPKAANSFFLCDYSSPFPNSTEGDKQMKWFSDLNFDNSGSPNAMETKESTFYAVAFDSSDDDGD
ncbi:interactor of HORMAD1 protein 1 [Dromiciops gliroides]|uniref:interactor of HORMAD1 protein 1 n=1 Tax=Dromiciops gliroides TaxID=33562 RepID=UPI001CC61FA1|nr:interactor of HORMAD1 protein 1 [Dromiciops gliroides]